ncbi:hypothetical protein [Herpetosiphon gulosus]|uniref:Uncharacterized protein n=1 Tax=Herpetosiphon gulosus TaxID=1973496 RepID=A0ABP9X4V2_9CHLR
MRRWLNRSIYNVKALRQQFAADHPELQPRTILIAKIIKNPLDQPIELVRGTNWVESLRAVVFVTTTGLWIYPIKKFAAMHGAASGIEQTEPFWLGGQSISTAQLMNVRTGLIRGSVLQFTYEQQAIYQFGLEYHVNLASLLPFEVTVTKGKIKHTTASIKARIYLYATVVFLGWFFLWFASIIIQALFR